MIKFALVVCMMGVIISFNTQTGLSTHFTLYLGLGTKQMILRTITESDQSVGLLLLGLYSRSGFP